MTDTPRKRGFALLDPEEMRRIAALGGRTAHQTGRAHQFTSAEGRAAGKKRAEQMKATGNYPGRKKKQA